MRQIFTRLPRAVCSRLHTFEIWVSKNCAIVCISVPGKGIEKNTYLLYLYFFKL